MSRACVCVCLLLPWASVAAQDNDELDGSEGVLRVLAEFYKDSRTIEQIKKDNALIRAAGEGDANAVRAALKGGALVNSRYLDGNAFLDGGRTGYTALMRASIGRHPEVVKVLIDAKADLDLERKGRTSLYMAVVADAEAVIRLLTKAGAKGDPEQIRQTQDLLRAACRGFKMRDGEGFPLYPGSIGSADMGPTIGEVLKRGAKVNSADPQGHTALMFAANLGLVDNVKILLANGADASLKSKAGETALSLAERRDSSVARAERAEVVVLLKAHLNKK